MPYLLPDAIEPLCTLQLSVPDDGEWIPIIIGALNELAKPYNWEDGTGLLTIEQATDFAMLMIQTSTIICPVILLDANGDLLTDDAGNFLVFS